MDCASILDCGCSISDKISCRPCNRGHEVEIEYTKKEYYSKIKSVMFNELKATLNNQITEDMLIFDKNGLIVAPNLSLNEAKRIFGEVNMRLTKNGK